MFFMGKKDTVLRNSRFAPLRCVVDFARIRKGISSAVCRRRRHMTTRAYSGNGAFEKLLTMTSYARGVLRIIRDIWERFSFTSNLFPVRGWKLMAGIAV